MAAAFEQFYHPGGLPECAVDEAEAGVTPDAMSDAELDVELAARDAALAALEAALDGGETRSGRGRGLADPGCGRTRGRAGLRVAWGRYTAEQIRGGVDVRAGAAEAGVQLARVLARLEATMEVATAAAELKLTCR
jgi:hypothetical protein